ncbi:hypothetical protein RND81_03G079500 [Saponaria officinalis]|uniref:Mannan endo-1,4-beta-mannosidase n=1 Tax=Saponaria officinalis TaxID=3572 RepID=A0AAW1M220_SAPOF
MTIETLLCSLFTGIQSLIQGCFGLTINRHVTHNSVFKVKAANLGCWLVTEGWMIPSLFSGIHNSDLLDGAQVQLKSMYIGKYLSAENGGGSILVANKAFALGWETFKLWRIDEKTFNFRVSSNQFIGLQSKGDGRGVAAEATIPGDSETFQIIRNLDDSSRVRIQAPNGLFLQALTQNLVTADYTGDGDWGDNNPSVFVMTVVKTFHGEYQLTNGYGPDKAPQVLKEHWDTYIVEDDFKFMSENGINTVRIPVGWWIAKDPTPPKPYVGGSLLYLDNAFVWAEKFDIKVIVNLHAVPESQNGYEHSATRDGSLDWGKSDESIQQSVEAIEFLTARYAQNTQLYAVELLNEPESGVPLETLTKYYKTGYEAVRRHSSSAYVVMSNRLGDDIDPKELFPLAGALPLTVIDVHYYNLFHDRFSTMTVQQNVDYINRKRISDLSTITTSDGPLTFIGTYKTASSFKQKFG